MKYKNVWLASVDIQAIEGRKFSELIDFDKESYEDFVGAWGNLIVKSDRINDVPRIIEEGLNELEMSVKVIDKIENLGTLIEYNEINKNVIEEVNWLLSTQFVFKISDKLFPYSGLT